MLALQKVYDFSLNRHTFFIQIDFCRKNNSFFCGFFLCALKNIFAFDDDI